MKNINIQRLVKQNIRGLRAYNAKEIPCLVKLDANESPYAWNQRELSRFSGSIKSNRYPDPEAKDLRKAAGKRFGVSPDWILQGNGSDELIYYLITTFGGPVLHPIPTFSMYGIIARALGEKGIGIPLNRQFDLDLKNMLLAVRKERPRLIFLSSPNNPTGNCFSAEKIMKLIESSGGIVVVDEAYQPFSSQRGFLPLLKDYQNLVILRTLSKIGLAALRIGFLLADTEIIGEVNKVRLPFNVNALSQKIAIAALKDAKGINASIRSIVSGRTRLFAAMHAMEGITTFPSEANFILFKAEDVEALYQKLIRKGIVVRNMNDVVTGCLRVTVGTPVENTVFLKVLRNALRR